MTPRAASATAAPSPSADRGKFVEIVSRRTANVLDSLDTLIKAGRLRGEAMKQDDKDKVLAALEGKVSELRKTWVPGSKPKAAKATGFVL